MKPFALFLAVLLLAAPAALAQTVRPAPPTDGARVPSFFTLPYQGHLADAAGTPVTATGLSFGFALWSASTGGSILWTESQTLDVADGLVEAHLGAVFPFGGSGPSVDFTQPLWLEVVVEGESLGRMPLGGVPLAGAAGAVVDDGVTPSALGLAGGSTEDGYAIVYDAPGNGFRLEPMPTGGSVSFPLTGSSSGSDATLTLANAGSGNALNITDAGNTALQINTATTGLYINSVTNDGVYIFGAGDDGVYVFDADDDGVQVQNASGRGLAIGHSNGDAVHVSTTNGSGVRVEQAAQYGVYAVSTGNPAGYFRNGSTTGSTLYAENTRSAIATGAVAHFVSNTSTSNASVLGLEAAGNAYLIDAYQGEGSAQSLVFRVMNTGTIYTEGNAIIKGNLTVDGTISKGGGTFRIDHPLDPANRTLTHSFVESPDMMNVYNGNARLDAAGEAWVELPTYFEALNRDFRYQLTCLGGHAPVYVAEEVEGNRFKIAGGTPGLRVSWQVTGVRQDPWAEAHRVVVEEDKAPEDRGSYLHPEAYGLPDARSLTARQAEPSAEGR